MSMLASLERLELLSFLDLLEGTEITMKEQENSVGK
jgi:hypothetical protein